MDKLHLQRSCACLALAFALSTSAARPVYPQSGTGAAQTGSAQAARIKSHSITGSVTVDGQPLGEVPVAFVSALHGNGIVMGDNSRTSLTGDTGAFGLDNLKPGPYRLYPSWLGYIVSSGVLDEDGRRIYYFPGDSATFRMVKGGVITGRVVDNAGAPMAQVPVRAIRLRDQQGRPVPPLLPSLAQIDKQLQTDDRGVYRIYGLDPGAYVVSAGGSATPFTQGLYDSDAPTYYPGSRRDAATEITVGQGQEVSGIDITYQNFSGHSIIGSVTGPIPPSSMLKAAFIVMTDAVTGSLQSISIAIDLNGVRNFQIDGVPDGKYNVTALAGFGAKDITLAPPRTVSVNGSDVSSVGLALSSIPQVTGVSIIDKAAPVDDSKKRCSPSKGLQYCVLSSHLRGINNGVFEGLESMGLALTRETVPDENGKFQVQLLGGPGRYHLEIRLPDDELYIKSVVIPPDSPGRAAIDASAGFPLVAGQSNINLSITLGEGAAGLSGRITTASPAVQMPARTGVVLIPAEPGSDGDVIRYLQATVRSDSTFQIRNIPPGQYFVFAREISNEELVEQLSDPIWANSDSRKKLHDEAERSGNIVELHQCQRTVDYSVRYPSSIEQSKSESKHNPQ
jgi:hypothetical protein